jgi:hypothetical protein
MESNIQEKKGMVLFIYWQQKLTHNKMNDRLRYMKKSLTMRTSRFYATTREVTLAFFFNWLTSLDIEKSSENHLYWLKIRNHSYFFSFSHRFRPIKGERLIWLVRRDMRTGQALFPLKIEPDITHEVGNKLNKIVVNILQRDQETTYRTKIIVKVWCPHQPYTSTCPDKMCTATGMLTCT